MNRSTSSILQQVQETLIKKKYSKSTLKSYSDWIYRFLFLYESEDIQNFGEKEIKGFLKFLEKECSMSSSTVNQALNAILLLYKEIWKIPVENYFFNTKRSTQKPNILKREEIKDILTFFSGEKWLMISLMYGCGLTARECVRLRIKNFNFNKSIIEIENSGRQTLFPKALQTPVLKQFKKIKHIINENKLLKNYGGVPLHYPPFLKKIKLSKAFGNHYLFPSRNLRFDKHTGLVIQQCISESYLQKLLKKIPDKTADSKTICCSSLRHSFATHLIEEGCDIHLVKEILGHKNLQSTVIYKDLANVEITNIISPLDVLILK